MTGASHPRVPAPVFNSHRTLLLNADYTPFTYPLEPLNAEDTIKGLCLGRYVVVEWSEAYARSPSMEMRLPSVVAVKDYVADVGLYGVPACNIGNLYVRDKGLCQYTGRELKLHGATTHALATMDHVVPKSKGGLLTWENTVLASQYANNLKGDKSLKDFGMELLTRPWVPKGADLLYLWLTEERLAALPQTWHAFLQVVPTPALRRVLEAAA